MIVVCHHFISWKHWTSCKINRSSNLVSQLRVNHPCRHIPNIHSEQRQNLQEDVSKHQTHQSPCPYHQSIHIINPHHHVPINGTYPSMDSIIHPHPSYRPSSVPASVPHGSRSPAAVQPRGASSAAPDVSSTVFTGRWCQPIETFESVGIIPKYPFQDSR